MTSPYRRDLWKRLYWRDWRYTRRAAKAYKRAARKRERQKLKVRHGVR